MKRLCGFPETQRRSRVPVKERRSLGDQQADGCCSLTFFGGAPLLGGGLTLNGCDGEGAERGDEKGRQDRDGPAAAPSVATHAGPQEVPGPVAELDAIGDHRPPPTLPSPPR